MGARADSSSPVDNCALLAASCDKADVGLAVRAAWAGGRVMSSPLSAVEICSLAGALEESSFGLSRPRYGVLLRLLSCAPPDLEGTCAAVRGALGRGVSVVIVGVGAGGRFDPSFAEEAEAAGATVVRDGELGEREGAGLLRLLRRVPDQMVEFLMSRNIKP
jgi:hypothetical protein